MQQQYCAKCGNALPEDSAFCNKCGTPLGPTVQVPPAPMPQGQMPPAPPYGQQPPMGHPAYGYQPPAYYQPPQKPKVPGRGLGVASMVLGILAALISFSNFTWIIEWFFATPYDIINEYATTAETMASAISDICSAGVMAVLALIFSLVSRKSGYKCEISLAGFILSIVGLSLTVASVASLIIL